MSRRVVSLFAALGLVASCARGPVPDTARANLITGSNGSDWYRIGSAIAERTNAHFAGQPVTAVPGAGGVSNPARIGRMPGDFGLSFLAFLRAATQGQSPYREAYPDLRHVATLLQNKLHLIATPRLGIASLDDVVARRLAVRVGTGPPGSAEEFLLRESLAALGATYHDLRSWGGRIDLLGSGERADLFRDGHIDVIAFHTPEPSSLITELMVSHPGTFLSLGPATRATMAQRWGAQPLTLDAGRYANLVEDVPTIGLDFGVFATADVSDALVYGMVKAIDEGQPYLATVHVGFRGWQSRTMSRNGGVPTHPGALRYFREKGWIE